MGQCKARSDGATTSTQDHDSQRQEEVSRSLHGAQHVQE